MLKGKILECESVQFSNGKNMYKVLINVIYDNKTVLQRIYQDKPLNVGSLYELNLFGSDDLKTMKIRADKEVLNTVDDSKKGIFNK